MVSKQRQYQHLYPPGDRRGCCTRYRFVVVVGGDIVTTRDAKSVSELVASMQLEARSSSLSERRRNDAKQPKRRAKR